ncbi:glycoside hydrolase family 61 protein [Biscogniauxia mediterranea]|nr:glycoside hydrolase family 61 protein [Biscogniauxia mediterranea]
MKSVLALALLGAAQAHYTFPGLIYNGETQADWAYVRKTTNYNSHGPVQDVTSDQIRCYQLAAGSEGAQTMAVQAGDTVGFRVDPEIQHPGPLSFWLARAPDGSTAETFDGDGAAWFKIAQDAPAFGGGQAVTWPNAGLAQVEATLPACLADGYYLLRVEHIALHSASTEGGAQFYQACAQLHVSGGGGGSETFPGVALPGAYSASDPGILINLYNPIPTNYTAPGPAVVSC